MDDPDAPQGVFTHWVLFNLPPDTRQLSEAYPTEGQLPDGARQGRNDFHRTGYGGPCPPSGPSAHRYRFTLYALDTSLSLSPGATRQEILTAIQSHVLAQGQLVGKYERGRIIIW